MKSQLVLEIESGRALTAITLNTIHFNISGHMLFNSKEEVEDFVQKWRHHFFDLRTLVVAEVKDRAR